MAIDRLTIINIPQEVFDEILRHCDHKDIPNLRLVCHQFAYRSTRALLRDNNALFYTRFRFTRKDLELVRFLSESYLAPFVNTFWFCSDLIPRSRGSVSIAQRFLPRDLEKRDRIRVPEEQLSEQEHEDLHHEQQGLLNNNEGLDMLCKAIDRFMNLESILVEATVLGFGNSLEFNHRACGLGPYPVIDLDYLVSALLSSAASLEGLLIESYCPEWYSYTKIRPEIGLDGYTESMEEFLEMLRKNCLEDFVISVLHLRVDKGRIHYGLTLASTWEVVNRLELKELSKISFGNLDMPFETLVEFLTRHASTLQEVGFKNSRIMDGDIAMLDEAIKDVLKVEIYYIIDS